MKRTVIAFILLLAASSACFAARYELVGGIRGALTAGVMAEEPINQNVALRGGIQLNTSDNPICVYAGGKFLLSYVGRTMPMSLGIGAVGFFGTTSDMGLSVSLIIDRFLDVRQLSLEGGIDLAGPLRFMLQLGYKL